MTGPEVAELLGCTRTSVYRMARDGRLPAPLWSHGRMLFRRHQLEVIARGWIAARARATAQATAEAGVTTAAKEAWDQAVAVVTSGVSRVTGDAAPEVPTSRRLAS